MSYFCYLVILLPTLKLDGIYFIFNQIQNLIWFKRQFLQYMPYCYNLKLSKILLVHPKCFFVYFINISIAPNKHSYCSFNFALAIDVDLNCFCICYVHWLMTSFMYCSLSLCKVIAHSTIAIWRATTIKSNQENKQRRGK